MSWQRILGHDALVESFRRVVGSNRLAHAYLFCGPEGVGKRLFATELAKALLCEAPPPSQPVTACDHCASCLLVDAGTHPDFFIVRKPEESNVLEVELMRELSDSFGLTIARGRGRVAILDNADDLNDSSANCFLKTLEEPPPRSVFILIGTDPQRQLPTVQSRCHAVRFAPLPESIIIQLLRGQGVDQPRLLQRAARAAGGSPGYALALTDEALWGFHDLLLDTLAQPKPDTVALASKFIAFVEEAGKEAPVQRRRAGLMLRMVLASLADVMAIYLGNSLPLEDADELARLRRLADRADPDKLLRMSERCLETEYHINRYVQLALVLEALMDALGQILEGSVMPR